MPLATAPLTPSPECADLKATIGDSLEPIVSSTPLTDQQRIEELDRNNKKLEMRVKDLETALTESRKIIRDRENLLSQMQWKPKDDFYVWKNPKVTDAQVKSEMESRLQNLTEQMRVMEKLLSDREHDIDVLAEQLAGCNLPDIQPSPFTSPMGSPAIRGAHNHAKTTRVSYPIRSPAEGPSWSRSPLASPASSPQQPSKKTWWFLSALSTKNNLADSANRNLVQTTLVDVL